jgi:formate dehydrogenase major subunit
MHHEDRRAGGPESDESGRICSTTANSATFRAGKPASGRRPHHGPAGAHLWLLESLLLVTRDVVHVVIDGKPGDFADGTSILAACQTMGISVPTLCHDERLTPSGACRLCLVNLTGRSRPVTACSTPLADGMVVETGTPDLEEERRSLLRWLTWHYPGNAVSRFPEKDFHRLIREYGLEPELAGRQRADLEDRSHPNILVDMSRCIDCYRCVQICDELQGQRVWHLRDRGLDTRVCPDGPTLRESSCVSCGACVDTCPTGALEDVGASALNGPLQWTRTTCAYCGTGCEMSVGTRDGRIISIRPVLDAPVSKGHLCVKGRYAFDFVDAPDRVTEPMIRDGRHWRRVSWNEARSFIATRLRELIDRHGADSVGVLGSARATNEDNYVAQKFARSVLGTNNVDCCARVCHAPSAAGLKAMFGAGLATNSFDDIELARTILVCGANATEGHPIVGARIRQAARHGAHLIVIDPRRIELTDDAACHLAIRPGTNVALLNAMANVIVTERLCDREFVDGRISGFDEFTRFIAAWPPARAAAVCGVDADAIRYAARLYATETPAMSVHGLGLTEHRQGTDGVMALINLALLTGNIGKPGAGVNPLRGQNNVQGAAHMGCDPSVLAGSTPLEQGREAFEKVWGRTIPRQRGLNLLEMMDDAAAGRLKALWTIGYDIFLTNPDARETARALGALDLVIVQDLFLTETAREFGTVFLPACSSFEKDGTFMNGERRIQRVRAALRPAGHSKPDWQILAETARAMGAAGFEYQGPEQIWDEIRGLCSGARGMTYVRLDREGLQWPCPDEQHPGTSILHEKTFAHGPRATLRALDYTASPEQTTPEFPLMLVTGRSLYHFNAGTMTGRSRRGELAPADRLDITPADAALLGIDDCALVRVVSAYGTSVLRAQLSAEVAVGQLFATFHAPAVFLNNVTGPHRDPTTSTPEYKLTAVRVEPVVDHPEFESLSLGKRT